MCNVKFRVAKARTGPPPPSWPVSGRCRDKVEQRAAMKNARLDAVHSLAGGIRVLSDALGKVNKRPPFAAVKVKVKVGCRKTLGWRKGNARLWPGRYSVGDFITTAESTCTVTSDEASTTTHANKAVGERTTTVPAAVKSLCVVEM